MPTQRSIARRSRVVHRCAAIAFLTLAAGCKGDGGGAVGPNPVIAGSWSGTAKAGLVRFAATFTQSGDSVGGVGRFTSPLASDDFTVHGTLAGAEVNLVLTSDELGATTFRGRFTRARRIVGILDLVAQDDLELTLYRR